MKVGEHFNTFQQKKIKNVLGSNADKQRIDFLWSPLLLFITILFLIFSSSLSCFCRVISMAFAIYLLLPGENDQGR